MSSPEFYKRNSLSKKIILHVNSSGAFILKFGTSWIERTKVKIFFELSNNNRSKYSRITNMAENYTHHCLSAIYHRNTFYSALLHPDGNPLFLRCWSNCLTNCDGDAGIRITKCYVLCGITTPSGTVQILFSLWLRPCLATWRIEQW